MTRDLAKIELLAKECERRAAQTDDREIKATFLEMAVGWRELADLRRRMEADQAGRRR